MPEERDLLAQASSQVGVDVRRRERLIEPWDEQPAQAPRTTSRVRRWPRLGGPSGRGAPRPPRPWPQPHRAPCSAARRTTASAINRRSALPGRDGRAYPRMRCRSSAMFASLEVERERTADRCELRDIEGADPGGDALAIDVGSPALPTGRRGGRRSLAADPLHEDEQLRAALLCDHLPERARRAGEPRDAADRGRARSRDPAARRRPREPGHPGACGSARDGRGPLGAIALGCPCVTSLSAVPRLRFDCKGTVPVPARNRV